MLERRILGEVPSKPHTVFRVKGKQGVEQVFTRDGFSGGFSIFYHPESPTAIKGFSLFKEDYNHLIGEPVDYKEIPNARRHFKTAALLSQSDYIASRTALLLNESCRVSTIRGTFEAWNYAFCNGQADELIFFQEGEGEIWTALGKLKFGPWDYVLIPRGISYVIQSTGHLEMFMMEGRPSLEVPSEFRNPFGQLKLEAPYTHRDIRSPQELLTKDEAENFKRILVLQNDVITEHIYSISPAYTVGWDGSVYPIAFNLKDYLPKTGKIHLPPNLHLTFRSSKFVVCSFVPRLVDYMEGAVPCPYPHSNHFCDEVLYYVSGNFTSRKGVGPKSISYHPGGVSHGPQPGQYEKSVGVERTNEVAVMIDTWEPLRITKHAMKVEDGSYSLSWQ